MAFDIKQRVFEDGDYDEEAGLNYREDLMERFAASLEGQEAERQNGLLGHAYTFMDYGMSYLGVTPPEMSPDQVEEILFDIFPRKVSADPGSGPEILLELQAFWTFLQREFQLPNAGKCLKMLRSTTGNDVERELQNPANFGIAKSFFMLGRQQGFDMTSEKGIQAFTQAYNAGLASNPVPSLPVPSLSPFSLFEDPEYPHPKRHAPKKAVTRRKMAQVSRRKNRKK